MKKMKLIIICVTFFIIKTTAQSSDETNKALLVPTLSEGTIEYDKKQVPCFTAEMPVSEDVAKDAIKKRFKEMGGTGSKEHKGFMEFKNVSRPDIKNGSPVDAYVKVERKSKKEKNTSLVSMIITDPGVSPDATDLRATNAAAGVAALGAFGLLTSLHDATTAHGLDLEIKEQEELLKKSEKKYNSLVKDGEDLQDKIKKAQQDMEANRNDQVKQAEELKKQKEKLLQIQSRQKITPGERAN